MSEYEVENAILEGDPMDQLCIAYNLILDNKRMGDAGRRTFLLCCIGISDHLPCNRLPHNADF